MSDYSDMDDDADMRDSGKDLMDTLRRLAQLDTVEGSRAAMLLPALEDGSLTDAVLEYTQAIETVRRDASDWDVGLVHVLEAAMKRYLQSWGIADDDIDSLPIEVQERIQSLAGKVIEWFPLGPNPPEIKGSTTPL